MHSVKTPGEIKRKTLRSENGMTAVDKDTEPGKGVLDQWDLENAQGWSFLRPLHLSQAVQGRTRGTL